jgi:maltooligosyltrehalose trehalohydrolase
VDQDDRVVTLHRGRIQLICNLSANAVARAHGEVLFAVGDVRLGDDLLVGPESFAIVAY